MEEEKPHDCPVCGSLEFMKENGYFYCIECQTQCEDIREQVFEEYDADHEDGDRMFGTPFVRQKRVKKDKTKNKGEDFTSWEVYNFILRGLVDELIAIGAPSSIKDTTLQMWAYYLQKIEVAFISKEEALLPKLAKRYRLKDAKVLYGLTKRKIKKKSKVTSVTAELNTTVSGLQDFCSMEIQKKWRRKAKKAYMSKVAETSIAEMSIADTENSLLNLSNNSSEFDDSLCVGSVSTQLENSSVSSYKIERTKDAVKWIEKHDHKEDARVRTENMADPADLSRFKVLNILYLALLYEGSSFLISDIMRWIREGHLSYHEVAKHIPEPCFAQSLHHNVISLSCIFPTYEHFLECSRYMAGFLKFIDWPDPDVTEIARKYVKELQLPEMFLDLIIRFVALIPMSYKGRFHNFTVRQDIPNYEGRVLAILIIIIKLFFGLDGKTEHQISKAASQLNKWMEQKKGNKKFTKLFVWSDWVKQLVCRTAVLAKYHFPTKQFLCPNSYGNPYAYINHSKKWNKDNRGHLEKYNSCDDHLVKNTDPFLINVLTSLLEKLQDPTCNDEVIDFPRSVTPYSLYIQNIIKKSSSANEPLIEASALKVLTEDFSKCDITYLLKPKSLSSIIKDNGQKLEIKNKSAQKKLTKFNYKRLRSNIDQTGPTYAWVIHCHHTKFNLTPPNSDNEEYYTKNRSMYNKRCRRLYRLGKSKNISKYEILLEDVKKIKEKRNNDASEVDPDLRKLESGKKGMLKKQTNSSTIVNSSSKSRKRKIRNSTKNSKMSKSKKPKRSRLSKMFKFYVPCSKYWINMNYAKLRNREFEMYILHSLPLSFSWLLSECAFISEMNRVALFREIIRIEKLVKNHFK